MADINELTPQTGRFLNEDNEKVNLADILGNTIRAGSIVGTLTIGTTATPLRLGATDLAERHTVQLINTGANAVYIGFSTAVTTANGIPCNAGEERSFALDPNDPLTLYAIATVANEVRLAEVK